LLGSQQWEPFFFGPIAEGFAEPADRPAPTEGRRRALGRRAREIVDEIVEKRGLKKE